MNLLSLAAAAEPTKTGTTAAGNVLGLEAITQLLILPISVIFSIKEVLGIY
jgi:hypothetical protein